MTLTRAWYQGARWPLLLVPLSLVYGVLARLWHLVFDLGLRKVHRVEGARVISVGNLVAGGAGKTPVTIFLAQRALDRGHTVAILTRGYGASHRAGVRAFTAGDLPPADEVGDEPRLIARACPVVTIWVGGDRVESARRAVASGATLLLLDDGFQHRRLHRDVDLLVDAGEGNGWPLPAGPLREWPSARRRATHIWGRDGRPGDFEARHALMSFVDERGERHPLHALRGVPVVVLTGIARPDRLVAQLSELGAHVIAVHAYADHHRFTDTELVHAQDVARRHQARVVTTAKDQERRAFAAIVVEQAVVLERGAELLDALLGMPS